MGRGKKIDDGMYLKLEKEMKLGLQLNYMKKRLDFHKGMAYGAKIAQTHQ